jgi:hypothetical protein
MRQENAFPLATVHRFWSMENANAPRIQFGETAELAVFQTVGRMKYGTTIQINADVLQGSTESTAYALVALLEQDTIKLWPSASQSVL